MSKRAKTRDAVSEVANSTSEIPSPLVAKLMELIEKYERKNAMKRLHRLPRVSEQTLNEMRSFEGAEMISGRPTCYAVDSYGRLLIWPPFDPEDNPDIYVE